MLNIIQTNHRSIAYEFVPLLLLLVLLLLLLLSLATAFTTATVTLSLLMSLLLLLLCCYCCHYCYWLPLLLLLSHYSATNTLLQILSLSGVVELTTQLLILENILLLPFVSNQQIWVEYSTLENCCDPLHLWVISQHVEWPC